MERKKIRKKHIIRWTCCILAVLLVGGMFYQYWYKPRHGYQPQPHTNEELLLLFEENRPLFDEVAQIISRNDRFWKEGKARKNDPYDTHIRISSPDEKNKMKLFTEEEQSVLCTFFEKIGPYMIILDLDDPTEAERERGRILERPKVLHLRIDFIKNDGKEVYSFIYYYDGNLNRDAYKKPVDLGDNWFCFTYI